MTQKRFYQIFGICLAAVCVFCASLGIAAVKIKKSRNDAAATTVPPLTQSQVQTTPAPAPTTTSQPDVTIGGNQITSAPAQDTSAGSTAPFDTTASNPVVSITDPQVTTPIVPATKGEIIAAYVNAVNQLKASTCTLTKTDNLNVSIDEMTPASVRSVAQRMIANNQNLEPRTFHFSGGYDASNGVSATHVIAPIDKNAALSESAVTAASATAVAGGGYQLKLTLGTEQQTLTTPAPNYSTSMEVLDTETMGLPSNAKIESFTITYSGGTIDATIDGQGRITAMQHHLIVTDAVGGGSLVVPVSVKMHGDHTGTYTVTY